MARYYSITATPLNGQAMTWTSHPGGAYDPGALNVQMDIPIAFMANDQGGCTITIEGIPLSSLLGSNQYYGGSIEVWGGMLPGLPLATLQSAGSGKIISGTIIQSFANWVGTQQDLNFVCYASTYTTKKPGNLVLHWPKGTPLSSAITNMLQVAYPSAKVTVNIGTYTNSYDVMHYAATLGDMAQMIKSMTQVGGSAGVDIILSSGTNITVQDGTVATNATQLQFTDLIGQPQWIDAATLQFYTPMRADIGVGSTVMMPTAYTTAANASTTSTSSSLPGLIGTSAAALPSQSKYNLSLSGKFIVNSARCVGNFRDPDGGQWCTVFQAAPVSLQSTATPASV